MDRSVGYKVVKRMINNHIEEINTMFLAIVENYDTTTGKITIIPKVKMLNNYDEYVDRAMLVECPTSCIKARDFYLRIPYQKGDIVYVGCSKDALDDMLLNGDTGVSRLDGVSKFRLTDAVVLGGIFVDSENTMTTDNPDDFIIQNRQNNDIIVLKKDGGIQVKTSTKFQIDASEVEINANTMNMNVRSTVTTGDSITQNVSTTINSGNVIISGSLQADTVDSTNGGISLENHTHQYDKPEHVAGKANTSVAK